MKILILFFGIVLSFSAFAEKNSAGRTPASDDPCSINLMAVSTENLGYAIGSDCDNFTFITQPATKMKLKDSDGGSCKKASFKKEAFGYSIAIDKAKLQHQSEVNEFDNGCVFYIRYPNKVRKTVDIQFSEN